MESWWQVDLGAVYEIKMVIITDDTYAVRLTKLLNRIVLRYTPGQICMNIICFNLSLQYNTIYIYIYILYCTVKIN